jgi:hypothetical protein
VLSTNQTAVALGIRMSDMRSSRNDGARPFGRAGYCHRYNAVLEKRERGSAGFPPIPLSRQ